MLNYSRSTKHYRRGSVERFKTGLRTRAMGEDFPWTFSRKPQESTLHILISPPSEDSKFEMVERCLFFQIKQKRLTLNLDKFLIRTAYEEREVVSQH